MTIATANDIMEMILESEDRWKSLYMGVWKAAYSFEKEYKHTKDWNQSVPLGLPGSIKKYQSYKICDLHKLLTTQDNDITLTHLQKTFSMIEELVKETRSILCKPGSKEVIYFQDLADFLKCKKKYKDIKKYTTTSCGFIARKEYPEFILAYETRNCFVHNGAKSTNKWLACYGKARRKKPPVGEGEKLPDMLHDVEKWHEIILNITKRIKSMLEEFTFKQAL